MNRYALAFLITFSVLANANDSKHIHLNKIYLLNSLKLLAGPITCIVGVAFFYDKRFVLGSSTTFVGTFTTLHALSKIYKEYTKNNKKSFLGKVLNK